jgi:hypothetical protein
MAGQEQEAVAAVREVLRRYVDATYHADVGVLKSLFHPQAFMAGYLGDQAIVGGPGPFFTDVGNRPAMAQTEVPYEAEIVAIHAWDRTASAIVLESGFFGEGRFVDHFHLVLAEGEWKIVSKTFETL